MASARIHEVIALKVNEDYHMDELLLRMGTVAPDCWRNAEGSDKFTTHFWDFNVKEGQANDYKRFYHKYQEQFNNPFYFGYLIHLMTDQYWKTYIDIKYRALKDGKEGFISREGNFIADENSFGHYESIKLQKQLALKYNLDVFPINQEEVLNFSCQIDELDLTGLFGKKGTLNYINTSYPMEEDEESIIYDLDDIDFFIDETVEFIKNELYLLEENN